MINKGTWCETTFLAQRVMLIDGTNTELLAGGYNLRDLEAFTEPFRIQMDCPDTPVQLSDKIKHYKTPIQRWTGILWYY